MNSLTLFQLTAIIVSSFFLVKGSLKFIRREKNQTFFKFFTNSFIWLTIGLFSIFPTQVHLLSDKIGFGESLNTFIFIGFVIIFMILFKLLTIIERIERNISEIVRKEALKILNKK